jgi:succinate-semialdehyde dehydrogenase / glutarate-semialdehyde dehydrogenase
MTKKTLVRERSNVHRKVFDVFDPADGAVVGQAAEQTPIEVQDAIERSALAQRRWAATSAEDRASLLHRWHAAILADADRLATLITSESGKPLREALAEVAYAASYVRWFAEEAVRADGDVLAGRSRERVFVVREPVGVVGAITPWNFPAAMVARKIAPAIAAGCSVVLKPSELTPLTALALAALLAQSGAPDDVLQVVTGTDAAGIGAALTGSPLVAKISFTGSTGVGRILMAASSNSLKRMSLELGGNAPFIVLADANLDAAIDGLMIAKFRNAGQTCVAANRILVAEAVHDEFVTRLVERVNCMTIGAGIADCDLGPLIDTHSANRVFGMVADAISQGAVLENPAVQPLDGAFVRPQILSGVDVGMTVAVKEIFGPVAPVMRFENDVQAVQLANATRAGLAGYVYGGEAERLWRVASALEVGMVGMNTGAISSASVPFGGVKESGFGREGSRYGLDDYISLKALTWKSSLFQ